MPENDDEPRGGVCPVCGKSDGYCNIGSQHWGSCEAHRIKWWIGSGLFSSWLDETEAEWRANAQRLASYALREPLPAFVRDDERAIATTLSRSKTFLGRIKISKSLWRWAPRWWREFEQEVLRYLPAGWTVTARLGDRGELIAAGGNQPHRMISWFDDVAIIDAHSKSITILVFRESPGGVVASIMKEVIREAELVRSDSDASL